MGGSSKSVTVGYKYYAGMHMVLCRGPIDKINSFKVDERILANGEYVSGTYAIAKENLFGGQSREGGVSGVLDVMLGEETQTVNSYLASKLGNFVPAFRGVVSVILRQMYLGLNPYLKAWTFNGTRIYTRQNGLDQWYEEKAAIFSGSFSANQFNENFSSGLAAYEHFTAPSTEGGGSMSDFTLVHDTYGLALNVGTGPANTHTAIKTPLPQVAALQECHFKVKLVSTGSDDCGVIAFRDSALNSVFNFGIKRDSTVDSQRRPTVSFVDKNQNPGTPLGPNGGVTAGVWYQVDVIYNARLRQFSIKMTNLTTSVVYAQATLNVGQRLPIAYVSFENDNYSGAGTCRFDDVQVITSFEQIDMNPAHILRECLTDPDWGMGYAEADIDDVSFTAAADTLYEENMGMSLLWDTQSTIEDFIALVCKHINASIYVDRVSGKFVLKLIRQDYDAETLLILDPSNVSQVKDFARAQFGELTNSVTVTYYNAQVADKSTITIQDIALAATQGAEINTGITYDGFTNQELASRVGQRDLKALSTPLASCTVYANTLAANLNIGDCFKLTWPDYDLNEVVMRVTSAGYGDGKSNRVRLTCSQDVFAMPDTSYIAPTPPEGVPTNDPPTPVTKRITLEMPYLEAVQQYGQSSVDSNLETNGDIGYLITAAARPQSNALSARLYTDAGQGYQEQANIDFCPFAELSEDIAPATGGAMVESFTIQNINEIAQVSPGSWFQIGTEIFEYVSLAGTTLTAKRGLLDTVPVKHLAGDTLFFWDLYAQGDSTQYVTGETINAKLATVTGSGVLALSAAPADALTLVGRMIKPYPPGNFKINGSYFPLAIGGTAALALTWAHRDRKQQTGGEYVDFTESNIGPEAGTTYTIRLYNEIDVLVHTESGVSGTSYTWPTVTEISESTIPVEGGAGDPYFNLVELNLHLNGTNGGTTFTDSSSRNRTVSRVGNTVTSTARFKYGTASALLDGVGDGLSIANTSNVWSHNVDFCCEGWFYLDSAVSGRTIQYFFSTRAFGSGDGINNTMSAIATLSSGSWYLNLVAWDNAGSAFQFIGPDAISLNAWHHIAVFKIGDNWYGSLDGVIQGTLNLPITNTNSTPLLIGYGNLGPDSRRELFGNFDDIRYTKGSGRYSSSGFAPPAAQNPDVGSYRLNGKIKVELESLRDGRTSYQAQTHIVLRNGYGFNYGSFYGQ